jgi:hypothetical protein
LDSFVRNAGIKHVDFIKLDVDGNENDVLEGAKAVLENSKPKIMLELAPYVYGSEPHMFDKLLDDLWRMGYQISDMATGRQLPQNSAAIRMLIPEGSGLNVLAAAPAYKSLSQPL